MGRIITASDDPRSRILRIDPADVLRAGHGRNAGRTLRLARGERCALQLDGDGGPVLVCEFERPGGPLRVSNRLDLQDPERPFEVRVDGQSLDRDHLDLDPGSRVEVVERSTGRRFRVQLATPAWYARPAWLAAVVVLGLLAGALYGAYLYQSLQQARSELASTQRALADSMATLRSAELARERALRAEFDLRLAAIREDARQAAGRLAEQDARAREHLARAIEADMRDRVRALEASFGERMVEAYENFKRMEARLARSLETRIAALTPAGTHFKGLLEASRQAILFVRTSYEVEFIPQGRSREQNALGSGFVIAASGLAMSARHVFYPWEYDRELNVLIGLELARVVPGSVRHSVWMEGQQVIDAADEETFDSGPAWNSSSGERRLRVIRAGAVELGPALVESPLGTVAVQTPLPGGGDAVVFQLGTAPEAAAAWPALPLASPHYRAAELDDVLVLGFPLSRLARGKAQVQALTGLVRRDRDELLELNIAFSRGVSGGPILDRDGAVIGLASGIADPATYGLAVRVADLAALRDAAVADILADERRLQRLGCSPGPVDGVFSEQTWQALDCEAQLHADWPP